MRRPVDRPVKGHYYAQAASLFLIPTRIPDIGSLTPGQTVAISGVSPSAYNGAYTVATAGSSQFTVALPLGVSPGSGSGGAVTSSGSTTSYCFDQNGSQVSSVAPDVNTSGTTPSCLTTQTATVTYANRRLQNAKFVCTHRSGGKCHY